MQPRAYILVAVALSLGYSVATTLDNTGTAPTEATITGPAIKIADDSWVTFQPAPKTVTANTGAAGTRSAPVNREPGTGTADATPEQQALYEQLQATIGNPQYLQTYALSDLVRQTRLLTPYQRDSLIAQGEQMLARGEITLNSFRPETFPRHRSISEGAPLPTREETSYYDELMIRMNDPEYLAGLSFDLLVQQAKPLPPALKQALADSVADNIRRGLIDAGKLLGPEYAGVRDVQLYLN